MTATAPSPVGPAVVDAPGDHLLNALQFDLQRSRIVCNTLDALFRRNEGLCPPSEAACLRDFVRGDLLRIYTIWSEDVIASIEHVCVADREARSLAATLQGELARLRVSAEELTAALDCYCEEPSEANQRVTGERLARFCPPHRSLVDWLQGNVLPWLARRLDASARQALAEAMKRPQDPPPAP